MNQTVIPCMGFRNHSDYCDPVPLLGQAHTGMTCTVMRFFAVIIKQIQRNKRKSGGTCTRIKIMLVLSKHPLSLKSSSYQECLTFSLPESVMEAHVVLTAESLDEILFCDNSNKTSSAVLSRGTIYI